MTKRKLTKQQSRRIREQQQARLNRAKEQTELTPDDQLGPELIGQAVAHHGKKVLVSPHNGNSQQIIHCFVRANVKSIVTGDQVVYREHEGNGVIVSVEPRKTELVRPDSYGKLKLVAANVDFMLITIAPIPEPYPNLIDRYLVAGENTGIEPIILINKKDLIAGEQAEKIEQITQLYQELEYKVFFVSAKAGDGFKPLSQYLSQGTSIFVGQSGVGKSSIIKKLLPDEEIKIGDLSDQVNKGRHTTTHSQLYQFAQGGSCIDSPGIREFGLWHFTSNQVLAGFRELKSLEGECKFRDCSHEQEPGCAINRALEEKIVSQERFASYKRILNSLDEVTIQRPRH
ncbi:small ribosomal subunit biogenesis GTPase RsgA [Teredinibacter sp. KSP-S5-2]|uniref:small ribosomal subunit biogenesis GTPase RsgA n=1 Tax=Teredinibacter sp. KSP-S5-2 TaxID=3034506 RepID=UPI002934CE8C|nr:small ribosomal subunit biogenesis GTPase RsgA [Teredinibacter sp. KSP-S5-2]WNO08183.1 small ribosomal subunit biogenesis GTPase RsgA [Teredinibacter sp. KSP-S5-2]